LSERITHSPLPPIRFDQSADLLGMVPVTGHSVGHKRSNTSEALRSTGKNQITVNGNKAGLLVREQPTDLKPGIAVVGVTANHVAIDSKLDHSDDRSNQFAVPNARPSGKVSEF